MEFENWYGLLSFSNRISAGFPYRLGRLRPRASTFRGGMEGLWPRCIIFVVIVIDLS
jgi:hypothetical protein